MESKNPLYPEDESPIIVLVISFLMVTSIIPAAFAPTSFQAVTSGGFAGFINTLGTFAFSQTAILFGFIWKVLKLAIRYVWVLILIAFILQVIVILNSFDHVIFGTLDQGTNKYVLPAYRGTVLPVAKVLDITVDMGVCWWDLAMMSRTILIVDTANVLVNCSAQDWQKFLNDTLTFVATTLAIPVWFIQEDGNQPFHVAQALDALAQALNDTQPSFRCACQELDFAYNILFDTITDRNLSLGLDAAVNTVIYYPFNITVTALDAAFGVGTSIYNCDQTNVTEKIDCVIHRPPYFIPLRESWCNLTDYAGYFVENTVDTIIDQFFDLNSRLFVFHKYLSALLCFPIHFLVDLLDLLSRPDMVFDSQVQYMRHWAFNDLINVAHKYCDGIEDFWAGFDDFYTTQIGTILGEIFRIVFNALNEIKNFMVALFYLIYDTNSVTDYFISFDQTVFTTPYGKIKSALFSLTEGINEPFGIVVEAIFNTTESAFKIPEKLVLFLAQDPTFPQLENWVITDLPPMTDAVAIDIHSVFVAIANFFRQFDTSCTQNTVNPPSIVALDLTNSHTVCQLADIIETIGQFIRSIWIQFTGTFYSLETDIINGSPISSYAPFISGYSTWLHTEVLTVYTNLIDSIAGLIGSMFQDISCPCTSNGCSTGAEGLASTNVRTNVSTMISAFIDTTIGNLYHFFVLFVDVIASAVNLANSFSNSGAQSLLCTLLSGVMDFFGRVFYLIKTIGDTLDCLIGTYSVSGSNVHINQFGGTVYYLIFDPNNTGSVRSMLCSWVSQALQAVQFIVGIISQGFNYITNLITTGATTVTNDVIDLINGVINQLNGDTLSAVQVLVSQIFAGLKSIVCFINRLISIFNCLTSINIGTSNYNLNINIPGFNIPAQHIDTGLFTIDIPEIDIKIPAFNIPLPLPDFSSITTAISCVTNGFNNIASGGCSGTCGPAVNGGIYPSFCTETPIIPDVPNIPHLKRDIYFVSDNSTNTTFANDTMIADVFQNYTMIICGNYYNLSMNETLGVNLRAFFTEQFVQCSVSAQMTFATNLLIFKNSTQDWLNPMTFSSVGSFLLSMLSVGYKLSGPISNEVACYGQFFEEKLVYNQSTLMTNSCRVWDTYYKDNNMTSPWVYNVGEFLQMIRLDITALWPQNTTFGWFDLFSTSWNAVSGFKSLMFDVQPGLNASIYDALLNSLTAFNQTLSTYTVRSFVTRHILPVLDMEKDGVKRWESKERFGFNLTDAIYNVTDRVYSFYRQRRDAISDALVAKSERTMRNRQSISAFYHVINSMYKEYSYRFGVFRDEENLKEYIKERNLPMLMSASNTDVTNIDSVDGAFYAWNKATRVGKDKIKYAMQYHVHEARGQRLNLPIDLFGNSSQICGIPTITGGTTCIDCALLKLTLDDFVQRAVQCVALTQTNWNILQDRYFTPFVQLIPNPFTMLDSQTDGVFSEWVEVHLNADFRQMESNMYYSMQSKVNQDTTTDAQPGPDLGFIVTPTAVIADYLDSLITAGVKALTGLEVEIKTIAINLKNYIVSKEVVISNSLYSWVDKFVTVKRTMDCGELAQEGIGIGNLLLSTGLVLLFMVVLAAILARISYALLSAFSVVFLMTPAIILSVNYGVSPLAFPAVPFCLADDIYEILNMGNVNCVNVTSLLPNITSSTCPDSSTDYSRDWLQCSNDPYFFNNPWRVLYYAVDYITPYWMNYVRTSDNYFLSAFRTINGMDQMMNFPYPAGQPTDDFTSCFKIRLHNLFVLWIYLVFMGALVAVLATSALLAAITAGNLVYFTGMMAVFSAHVVTGGQTAGTSTTILNGTDYIVSNLVNSKNFSKFNKGDYEHMMDISYTESRADRFSNGESSDIGNGFKKFLRRMVTPSVIRRKKKDD